jgi:hypothetical protein
VSLDEPQPLVRPARDLGEDVRSVGIAEIVALSDRRSHGLAERRQSVRQGLDVVARVGALGAVFSECRSPGDRAHRSVRDSTQLDGTLGDQVDNLLDVLVYVVEELVKGDESRPLDVPVRLLALRL